TPEEREQCRAAIASARADGIFTPPSTRGTVIFPGNIGGSNWSGAAWDSAHDRLVTPNNRLAFLVRLVPRDSIMEERRRFPGSEISQQRGTPYGMRRDALLSPRGVPCNPPPWGALTAIDLTSGEKKWESPLGWVPRLADHAEYRQWGSINLGGAMITGGGLIFASGGWDEHLHAFDVDTGRELWNAGLPAGGNAMPMTYTTRSGRQFVVIVAGGHDRLRTSLGR